MEYAGFWRRFAAYTLDALIFGLIVAMLLVAAMMAMVVAGLRLPQPDPHDLLSVGNLLGNLAGVALLWLYFAVQESGWRQATFGKRLMGIEVCDLAGERISLGRATGRYFGKFLSTLPLLAGFVMAAFTARRQALHDKLAGTVVIRTPDASATLGWVLFGVLMVAQAVIVVVTVALVIPDLQAQRRLMELPPVVRVATNAADAVDAYYAQYDDLPRALADTTFDAAAVDAGVLVALEPDSGRLTVVLRDGSVMLAMTPKPAARGELAWQCEIAPDEQQYYPPQCAY